MIHIRMIATHVPMIHIAISSAGSAAAGMGPRAIFKNASLIAGLGSTLTTAITAVGRLLVNHNVAASLLAAAGAGYIRDRTICL